MGAGSSSQPEKSQERVGRGGGAGGGGGGATQTRHSSTSGSRGSFSSHTSAMPAVHPSGSASNASCGPEPRTDSRHRRHSGSQSSVSSRDTSPSPPVATRSRGPHVTQTRPARSSQAALVSPHDVPLKSSDKRPSHVTGAPGARTVTRGSAQPSNGYTNLTPQASAQYAYSPEHAPLFQLATRISDQSNHPGTDYMVENLEVSLSDQHPSLEYSYSCASPSVSVQEFDLRGFLLGTKSDTQAKSSSTAGTSGVPRDTCKPPQPLPLVPANAAANRRKASNRPSEAVHTRASTVVAPPPPASPKHVPRPEPAKMSDLRYPSQETLLSTGQSVSNGSYGETSSLLDTNNKKKNAAPLPRSSSPPQPDGCSTESGREDLATMTNTFDAYFAGADWTNIPSSQTNAQVATTGVAQRHTAAQSQLCTSPQRGGRAALASPPPPQQAPKPLASVPAATKSPPQHNRSEVRPSKDEQEREPATKKRVRPLLRALDEQPRVHRGSAQNQNASPSPLAAAESILPRPASKGANETPPTNADGTQDNHAAAPLLERITSSKMRRRASSTPASGGSDSAHRRRARRARDDVPCPDSAERVTSATSRRSPPPPAAAQTSPGYYSAPQLATQLSPSSTVNPPQTSRTAPASTLVSPRPSLPTAQGAATASQHRMAVPATANVNPAFVQQRRNSESNRAPMERPAGASSQPMTRPATVNGAARPRGRGLSQLETSTDAMVVPDMNATVPNAATPPPAPQEAAVVDHRPFSDPLPARDGHGTTPVTLPSSSDDGDDDDTSSSSSSSSDPDSDSDSDSDSNTNNTTSFEATTSLQMASVHSADTANAAGGEATPAAPDEDDVPLSNLPTSARRLRRRVSFADEKHMPLENHV